ncbi:MAG TPA: recombinase family protein [Georgenia sp.]|nr:recombinase family protein [Georgenia sp.]
MKARIYIRVSTDEQAQEGYSLAAQEDRCRQFVESQGWEFTGVYKDDGYSAKDLKRPAMQQVLADVKSKEFDVLVVYRLDRLVRSATDLHYLLELFDTHNVMFKSCTEAFDTTTATGRLFLSITGLIAQWERENLAERVKVGMERKAREGKRVGGFAPYGYQIDPTTGKLVIDETEAAIVRRIFEMYKTMGFRKIATVLNAEGIKTVGGAMWMWRNIKYILENPVYIGHTRWNYNEKSKVAKTNEVTIFENTHEPIIDIELFNKTQELIKKRRERPSPSMTSDYPFSSVLVCSRCGYSFVGQTVKHKYRVARKYRCRGRLTYGVCNQPLVDENSLLETLFNQLDWFVEENDIKDIDTGNKTVDKDQRRKEIEKELQKIKERRKKWQYAFANDAITLEELKQLTQEDRIREKKLEEELINLPAIEEKPEISKKELMEQIQSLKEVWPKLEPQVQKKLITTIFKTLVVDVDERVTPISFRSRPVKILRFELNG